MFCIWLGITRISYIYFQIKMEIFIVEPSEQIDVVKQEEVKEEPEEDPLAGKKNPSAIETQGFGCE